jgi:hypothetical protein
MRSTLFVVVAACGGAAARQPIANQATPTRRPVCTDDIVEQLAQKLADRWVTDKLDVRCAAGRFGVDGYFIEARNAEFHRTGIVDASGAELVAFVDEPEPDAGVFLNGYQAADVDGDGDDEIIESWRRSTHEGLDPDSWLVVRRIASGKFSSKIRGPYVQRYHPELGGCSATWEARAGSLFVAVDVKPGIPPSGCLPEGTHRFALRGRSLIERRVR